AGPFDDTVRALGRGEIDPASPWLRIAAASRERALAWYDNPRYASDLGAILSELALAHPRGDPDRRALVEAALQRDAQAVAGAPAQPFSWTRLAQGTLERDGAGAGIAAPLAMSYRTAPA